MAAHLSFSSRSGTNDAQCLIFGHQAQWTKENSRRLSPLRSFVPAKRKPCGRPLILHSAMIRPVARRRCWCTGEDRLFQPTWTYGRDPYPMQRRENANRAPIVGTLQNPADQPGRSTSQRESSRIARQSGGAGSCRRGVPRPRSRFIPGEEAAFRGPTASLLCGPRARRRPAFGTPGFNGIVRFSIG